MTDDLLRGADTAELRFHPAAVQKDERRDAHDARRADRHGRFRCGARKAGGGRSAVTLQGNFRQRAGQRPDAADLKIQGGSLT